MYNISFLGAPGAGKGTQAAIIAGRLNLVHIASGDLFRQAIERGDDLGRQVKAYLERGELVPDKITIGVVLGHLSALGKGPGAVLDGFPRNLRQAEALDRAAAGSSKGIDGLVYIRVSEEELVSRLSGRWLCRDCQSPYSIEGGKETGASQRCSRCDGVLYQRPDDRPEKIKKRFRVYLAETAPLIGYYKKRGKLIEVDGEGSVDEVARRIIDALEKKGFAGLDEHNN